MNAIHGRVTSSGRISLPAEFRRAVGLHDGGDVVVEPAGDEIRIRSIDAVVARAGAISPYPRRSPGGWRAGIS